jgi:ribosome-associated protein
MTDPNTQDLDEGSKSKSQLKREAEAKQKLAERLVDISEANLAKMPLEHDLLEAVKTARKINRKKEGFRRQLQLLGKLMREVDTAPIESALNLLGNQHLQANAHFHYLEHARDSIVTQGNEAIERLVAKYPALDRQKLRQLQRKAVKESELNKPPIASRGLFKYLRESIQE